MIYKVNLKNSDDTVLLDEEVYHHLSKDAYFAKIGLLENLRKHSGGCAVFQKAWPQKDGTYKAETIYIHKYIAEMFLKDQKSKENNLVGCINGNKLDCRLENIVWRSRSVISRLRKTRSKTGYTGVYKENSRFRAVISVNRKTVHIGMYDTPEEAALAYNKESRRLFGKEGKQNIVTAASKK